MERITDATGKVIPWRRSSTRMELVRLNTLRAYWEALRDEAAGEVPARERVDPRGFSNALENAFLLEQVAPGMAKLRLAGQHLNDLMGMELRGMPFASLLFAQDRAVAERVLAQVFDDPAEAELRLRPARLGNAPDAAARMLLLPLRDRDGAVTAALGGLVSAGTTGPRPQRFEITAINVTPCAGAAPGRTPSVAEDRPAPGFAEPAAGFDGARRQPPRGRPHLRVVKSDD